MQHSIINYIFAGAAGLSITFSVNDVAHEVIGAATPPPIEGSATIPETVVAGETYLVDWLLNKRTACPGGNSRVWNGADGFHLTEQEKPTSLPSDGVLRSYSIPTKIPEYAPSGALALSIEAWYQCPGSERVSVTLGPVYTVVE